jgi:hypothetical protein
LIISFKAPGLILSVAAMIVEATLICYAGVAKAAFFPLTAY